MISLNVPSRVCFQVDHDGTAIPCWPITGAVWVSVGATCATAGGSLGFRLVFCDTEGNLTGVSPVFTVTCSSGPADWGSAWLGTPTAEGLQSIAVSADQMGVKVDSITGVWTLNAQGFFPPSAAS